MLLAPHIHTTQQGSQIHFLAPRSWGGGVAVTTGYALPLVEGHWGVCVCECFPSAFFSLHCIQHACVLSRVQLSATLWTVAHQDPLSMELSRQQYWSGLLFPSAEDLLCV